MVNDNTRMNESCTHPLQDDDVVPMKFITRINGPPLIVTTESQATMMPVVDSSETTIGFLPPNPLSSIMTLSTIALSASIILLLLLTLRKLSRMFHKHHQQQSKYSNLPKFIFPPSTKLPPCSVPSHPIYGHMPHVFSPPDSAKFKSIFVDNANPCGISTFWFLNTPCMSVLKAEHARVVFRNSIEREGSKVITRHFKRCLGQDSLVMMQGGESDRDKWRQHRNLIKVAFTTRAVENMADKVWSVANGFCSSILNQCTTSSESRYTAEAADLFKWVTLDVFGKVAFNYNFGCTETLTTTPLAHSLNLTVEDCSSRCLPRNLLNPACQFYWLPTKRNREFARHSDNVHGLLREICQRRWAEMTPMSENNGETSRHGENDDLLTALLKSKAKESRGNDTINPDDSHDDSVKMLLTFIFAGYDTSSVLLSMAMWSVVQNPTIQEECAREAHIASTNTDDEPSLHEDASKWESRLAYCKAAILETVRLHPPVYNNGRNISKEMELDGYTIPKRTRVYLPIMQIHTDERNFARPLEFLPERWVRRDADTGRWVPRDHRTEPPSVDGDPTYIPPANPHYVFSFSDGARNCVGHRLAMQESTLVFACLVRDLTVHVRDGFVMQKRRKFALAPPVEMPLIFKKRVWEKR